MSHTYAILQISKSAFDEIRGKLKDAGYEHAFDDAAEGGPVVDMHGTAVQAEPLPWDDISDPGKKLACMTESFRAGLEDLCKRHHVRLMHGKDEGELSIVVDCEPGFDEAIQAEWNGLKYDSSKP